MITISLNSVLRWMTALAVVAALFAGLSPSSADASGSGDVNKLARRVLALERKVADLEKQAKQLRAGPRLNALEDKARYLDSDGSYYGYVNSSQVWSHYCADGEAARWKDFEGYVELTCPSGSASSAASPDAPTVTAP